MHRLVEGLGYVIPGSLCYEHVDDLSQSVATVNDEIKAVRAGLDIGLKVAQGVKDLDLKLSEKSVLLPASSPAVRIIVKLLNAKGITIKAANSSEDLGIGVSAGRRRVASSMNSRIERGRKRASATHQLSKLVQGAVQLAKTGVATQQAYGHQGAGASPTQVD